MRLAVGVAALAMLASGCGAATHTSTGEHEASTSTPRVETQPLTPAANRRAFSWLQPAAAPAGWDSASIARGLTLHYPPTWQRVPGDHGTVSAALKNAEGEFLGYLNLTPRQAGEQLGTWASFRTHHNAEEGDRDVKQLAAVTSVRFRSGQASCVRDSYTTGTGDRFIELACLVRGPRATSVIVGAAPPREWARTSPLLERSISAFGA